MSDRGAFIWYELMTTDPIGAKAFYDEVVGWNLQQDGTDMGGGTEYRMIGRSDGKFAGGVLTLTESMCDTGMRPCWVAYIDHPDVDAAARTVEAAGGTVFMPPTDMEGVGRIAMVADPQGAAFYLMNPTPPMADPQAKSDVFDYEKAERVRWNELQTTDPAAAVSFYTGLFGWQQEGAMPMGAMGEYQFLQREGGMFGALMPKMPDVPRSAWTFYIGVDDIDRAAAAVETRGGKLAGEIQQIPGGDYAVHALDPAGAAIGFVGPRKG